MKSTFTLLLGIISLWAYSQSTKNVENSQTTLNFLLPGLVYEQGIAPNATIAGEVTIGFAVIDCSNCESSFGIYPIGKLQYRYYYNLDRRSDRGKRITGNSGNYVAPMVALQGGDAIIGDLDFASNFFLGAGAVYGIQRTAPSGFQFRLEAGPAYFFDEFSDGLGLFLAAKLGWVIGNKRK